MKISSLINSNSPSYSLEFFPPRNDSLWDSFFSTVEKLKVINPSFASVTYGAGGSTSDNTLEVTSRLAALDLLPMAHLTCVGATKESIRDYLEKLRANNVTNVLALRGDLKKGQEDSCYSKDFGYAIDLAKFVRTEFPDFGVAVAAYPTPHPQSKSYKEDRDHLKNKLENYADFAITQLFFDHRDYEELVRQLKKSGTNKPILPGILPIQSFDSLKRILSLSGCNIPSKLYLSLEEAHEKGGSAAVKEAGTKFAIDLIKKLLNANAPGIHLYTLNQADTCLNIFNEIGKLS